MNIFKIVTVFLVVLVLIQFYVIEMLFKNYLFDAQDQVLHVIERPLYYGVKERFKNVEISCSREGYFLQSKQAYKLGYPRELNYDWHFKGFKDNQERDAVYNIIAEGNYLDYYGVETSFESFDRELKIRHKIDWEKKKIYSLRFSAFRQLLHRDEKLKILGGRRPFSGRPGI